MLKHWKEKLKKTLEYGQIFNVPVRTDIVKVAILPKESADQTNSH